jgi:hypothetical protein
MYLAVAVLLLLLLLVGYTLHTVRSSRAYIWPVAVLRLGLFACVEVCYVGVLDIFFVAIDCQWTSGSKHDVNHNREYPDKGARRHGGGAALSLSLRSAAAAAPSATPPPRCRCRPLITCFFPSPKHYPWPPPNPCAPQSA